MNEAAISTAIELVLQLLTRAQQISTVIAAAQSAGRTSLTVEEWTAITTEDDVQRKSLVDALDATGSG